MRVLIAVLLSVLVSSCAWFNSSTKKNTVNYEMIYQANEHNLDFKGASVISNKDEMYKAYVELNKTRKPGLPLPEVNFEKESLVFVSYHIKNMKNNDIEIESVIGKNEELMINVTEFLNPKTPNDQIYKYPFFIMKVEGNFAKATINN